LRAVSGTAPGQFRCPAEKLLDRFCSDLASVTVDDLLRHGLHEYLDQFQMKLNQTTQAITERFFRVEPPPAAITPAVNGSVLTTVLPK
jgi:uncharacterized alpha-E superfamily protein